jgi:hypothetical protein
MPKITPTLVKSYSEIGQENPLRWEILYKVADDEYESQSGLIRCKDFFNELVRKYNTGQDSAIYRFDTKEIKLNDEGIYFRMHYIADMDVFNTNLSSTVSDVTNEKLDKTTSLLFIPRKYFASTYLTSLVSYVIRICNVKTLVGTLEEAITNTTDIAIKEDGKAFAKKWRFNVPENYQQYWYYCGDKENSVVNPTPIYAVVIHNNGVQSWSSYVTN